MESKLSKLFPARVVLHDDGTTNDISCAVNDLGSASAFVRSYIEDNRLTEREWRRGARSGLVLNCDGNPIARIGYDGKIQSEVSSKNKPQSEQRETAFNPSLAARYAFNPSLEEVVLEVWTRGMDNKPAKLLRSWLVNHNQQVGRALTAFEARKAILEGHIFLSRTR